MKKCLGKKDKEILELAEFLQETGKLTSLSSWKHYFYSFYGKRLNTEILLDRLERIKWKLNADTIPGAILKYKEVMRKWQ